MDDWSDLDIFHAVAAEGSLAAAARRLKISHPTIGRRLDALETRLGGQLVQRGAQGAALTLLGQTILENVQRMGREAEAIRRVADGGAQALAGVVSITAPDGIGASVLPVMLADLRERHPDLLFHADVTTRTLNLARREADIAIRFGRAGDQASLITRRVFRLGLGLYAAPAYLDRRGRPQRVADLAEHDGVRSIYDAAIWPETINDVAAAPKRVTFEAANPAALHTAIVAGFGVGAQSHWRARGAGSLERILPEVELEPIDVWLVTHADMKRNARIRLVFDHLAARFSASKRYFLEGDPDIPERVV